MKKPIPPNKPYKPYQPLKTRKTTQYINITELLTKDPSIEELIKNLQNVIIKNNLTIADAYLHLEIDDAFGASDYYGDPIFANLCYSKEEPSLFYEAEVKLYKNDNKKYQKDLKVYQLKLAEYEIQKKKWDEQEAKRLLRSKKKLLVKLKKELNDE